VYAVAQFDQGKKSESLKTLGRIHQRYPASREILQLLAGYSRQMGRIKAAEAYTAELKKLGGSP
jgi:Tfp pilus assembly protein PilF